MTKIQSFMVLVVLACFLWTCSKGDTEVTCEFNNSCLLPAQFEFSSDPVIYWIHVTADKMWVHAYFNNQDQPDDQDQHFTNRTSLFQDQISRGNASLLLRGVKVQDQGTYMCDISTRNKVEQIYVAVKVEAPVSTVSISQEEEDRITCSSEGIYPEPELTWSTIPPSNTKLQPQTRVHQTEDQFFSISSDLMVSGSDQIYSCTVRTQRNQRRATVNKPVSVSVSESETTISCSSTDVSASSFTWRFNQSQIIVTKSEGNSSYNVSEEWRKHVEQVSESGSLTLQSLSSQLNGVYTCEVANSQEETIFSNTFLRINDRTSVWIGVGVISAVVVVVAVAVAVLAAKRNAAAVLVVAVVVAAIAAVAAGVAAIMSVVQTVTREPIAAPAAVAAATAVVATLGAAAVAAVEGAITCVGIIRQKCQNFCVSTHEQNSSPTAPSSVEEHPLRTTNTNQ